MSTTSARVIATHSGSFHCDEALAVGLLRLTKEFAGAGVRRSRDAAVLAEADIVVDVGGEYDAERRLFDHHQRTFEGTFDDGHATKLSSAGLVYKHFGREVVANVVGDAVDGDTLELVYHKMYDGFVESIDAIDNGISQYPADLTPAYKSNGTDLGSRVAALNPRWNEVLEGDDTVDARFEKAVALTTEAFVGKLEGIVYSWLPARTLVAAALAAAPDVHPSGAIIKFDTHCPWKSHLFDLEAEHGIEGRIHYALFTDQSGMWRVQAVPVTPSSFASRTPLHEAWRGLRDDELDAATGIPGGKFVHASGFIGGHATYDGVLALAVKSLELAAPAAP